jgi:multidrug efflux pump subunit AcrA (membrane-fusion protein)
LIDDPTPELRPGMSVRVEIITAELRDVLWLPSQAVFNRDGQRFVYLKKSNGFSPSDVELVRAGESKLAIQGLKENDVVALADPTQQKETGAAPSASDVISRP